MIFHFAIDIMIIPIIACAFILEYSRTLTLDTLYIDERKLSMVIEFLNVFFYFKLLVTIVEVKMRYKKWNDNFLIHNVDLPEFLKPQLKPPISNYYAEIEFS